MPSSIAPSQTDQQDAWSTSPANVDVPSVDSALSDSIEGLSGGNAAPQIFVSDVHPAHEDPSSGSAAAAQQDLISVDIAARAPAGGNAASILLMAPKPQRRVSEPDSAAASSPNMFQAADAANGVSHGKMYGIPASPGRSDSTSAERISEATQQSRAGTTLPSSQPNSLKPAAMNKRQPTVIPHMAAVGALVGALARANELDQALQLYKQVCSKSLLYASPQFGWPWPELLNCVQCLWPNGMGFGWSMCGERPLHKLHGVLRMGAQVERDPVGAQALTMSDRTMWQSLMELCCRKARTADALQVTQRKSLSLHCASALLDSSCTSIQEKLLFCFVEQVESCAVLVSGLSCRVTETGPTQQEHLPAAGV